MLDAGRLIKGQGSCLRKMQYDGNAIGHVRLLHLRQVNVRWCQTIQSFYKFMIEYTVNKNVS